MPTPDEIRKAYSEKPDEDLLWMAACPDALDETSRGALRFELRRRNLRHGALESNWRTQNGRPQMASSNETIGVDREERLRYGLGMVERGCWVCAGAVICLPIWLSKSTPASADDWLAFLLFSVFMVLFAITAIKAGIGVRRRRKFGRIMALVIACIITLSGIGSIVGALVSYLIESWAILIFGGLAVFLSVPSAISVWFIFYLLRPDVKDAFGG